LFGIAMMASAVEDLICARLGLKVRGVPWFPGNSFWAYLTGIALLAAGLSIVTNIRARLTAALLGILFLCYVVLFEIAAVIANPLNVSVRTVAFETLAMCGAALTLADTLPGDRFNKLTASGPYLFGVSSIVFGIDHFLVLDIIASLVPAWLPWHLFWAYLTGAAFIAVGLSILTGWMDRLGATLLGMMFMLWFFTLHLPRSVIALRSHHPNLPDEWSSAFIALAMWGGSWICAWHAQQRRSRFMLSS